jgi:hypothetical protein
MLYLRHMRLRVLVSKRKERGDVIWYVERIFEKGEWSGF